MRELLSLSSGRNDDLCARSRERHLLAKRLASSSPAALAGILGVPVSSMPASTLASPSPSPALPITPNPLAWPQTAFPSTPMVAERTADETISTSTVSVSDYFRQKMQAKMASQAAASGSTTPIDQTSLAVKEEVKVAVEGVKWEGSKTLFGEPTTTPDLGRLVPKLEPVQDLPNIKQESPTVSKPDLIDAGPSDILPPASSSDEKALKRARKEAKRLRKLKTSLLPPGESSNTPSTAFETETPRHSQRTESPIERYAYQEEETEGERKKRKKGKAGRSKAKKAKLKGVPGSST